MLSAPFSMYNDKNKFIGKEEKGIFEDVSKIVKIGL